MPLRSFVRSPSSGSEKSLRDPKAKDTAAIRAAELLLERGHGKAPAFYTNDPSEFRDVLEMTDQDIRDRLAVIRSILPEHGVDPVALPSPREGGQRH
jgi:hypothetical protein